MEVVEKPLLNETDAARSLNTSVGTLRNWRCQGRGPAYAKIGTSVRYRSKDIEDYIEAHTRRPACDHNAKVGPRDRVTTGV